jgi:hypothetical protein
MNTTHKETLGCTPYFASHGYAACLGQDSPTEGIQEVHHDEEGLETQSPSTLQHIEASSRLWREQVRSSHLFHREQYAKRLNSGRQVPLFSLRDSVAIYLPPTKATSRRKAKHALQFTGPCLVSSLIGRTSYEVKHIDTGQIYRRSIKNVVPYTLSEEYERKASALLLHPIFNPNVFPRESSQDDWTRPWKVNEYTICRDSSEHSNWWLAKVTKVTKKTITVHYLGTQAATANAIFTPMFHKGNLLQLGKTTGTRPYSGTIDKKDTFLFYVRNVPFSDAKTISEALRSRLSPRTHVTISRQAHPPTSTSTSDPTGSGE